MKIIVRPACCCGLLAACSPQPSAEARRTGAERRTHRERLAPGLGACR